MTSKRVGRKMPPQKASTITLAIISGLTAIIIAAIGIYKAPHANSVKQSVNETASPEAPSSHSNHKQLFLTGTLIDGMTNEGIRTADITFYVNGKPESYVTEETGNFRFVLPAEWTEENPVRVRVVKPGYNTVDRSYLPADGVVIAMTRY